jgi:hypothetical protein
VVIGEVSPPTVERTQAAPNGEQARRLTEEEDIEVQKLIAQGMDGRLARAAVLGEDPGLD